MNKILPLLLSFLLYTSASIAQQRIEYANFIQTDTAVKWAAIYNSYVNLTPANPNFNIRNFYVNKLKRQTVTAYLEDSAAFAVTSNSISYNEYRSSIKKVDYDASKMNWNSYYDEKMDASEAVFNQEANLCDTCTLANKFSFFKIKQLLYYKNNRLQIRNLLLCPVIYNKRDSVFRESAAYFETSNFAFNSLKNDDTVIPAAAKYIGRSSNILDLRPTAQNNTSGSNILTLRNWNLAELFYKDIKKRILKAYDTDNSIYPDTKKILDYHKIEEYKMEPVQVAVFDNDGNVTSYRQMRPEINFDSISKYTLVQDFYFDFDKEILYSKLVAVAPRIAVRTSQGVFLGYRNYWGIIFPEEKKKIAKQVKR